MQYLRPSVQCEFEGSVHGQALGEGQNLYCMMDVEANPDNFGGVVWISFGDIDLYSYTAVMVKRIS